jgi:tetratricopeptide (TPR) repeat protein
LRFIKSVSLFTLLIVLGAGCSTLEKSYQKTRKAMTNLVNSAEDTYRPALGLDNDVDLQFAKHQFNRREYATSEFYLKKTLANNPENREAIQLLPWTYFFQKRFDKALASFKQAHTLHRKNPFPLLGMGWASFSLKQYQKALESFERAERFAPNSYEIHKGKAFIYLEQRRSQLAKEELDKIFSPIKVAELLEAWDLTNRDDTTMRWEIVPSNPESNSIFTLPVEFPRYRSLLLGMPSEDVEDMDLAWESYYQGKYTKAAKLFSSLARSNSLDAVNGLAWSLLQSKQINKSEKAFKEILELYPRFIGAFKGLKEIEEIKKHQAVYVQNYIDMGKYQLAANKLDDLLDRYDDWAHLYNQYGKIFLARKEFKRAREYFLDAQKYSPDDSTSKLGMEQVQLALDKQLYKADQAFKKGDYKLSTIIYHDYVGDDTWPSPQFNLAHAYNGLGWSQFYKKQYEYAINKFLKSIEHDDYMASSAKGLGLSLFAIKNYSDAIPYLEMALKFDPADKDLAYKLDWSILRSESLSFAQQYFEKVIKEHPLRASPYMALGWIHYNFRNPDLGIEYFLKAISLDPDFAMTPEFIALLEKERFGWQVYNSLGWTYYQNQLNDRAMQMFKYSLKIQPNKSEARKGMGYIYFRLGKYDSAITMLEQCLALNPEPNPVFEQVTGSNAIGPFLMQTTPRTKLGRMLYIKENILSAINYFNEEIRRNPSQPDAYDGLGWAYLKQGRTLEARTAFTTAVRLEPLNNSAQNGLVKSKHAIAEERLKTKTASPFYFLQTSPN